MATAISCLMRTRAAAEVEVISSARHPLGGYFVRVITRTNRSGNDKGVAVRARQRHVVRVAIFVTLRAWAYIFSE